MSAGSTLRLDATLKANFGKTPILTIFVETAPNASGPWVQLYSRTFATGSSSPWPANCVQRIAVSGFDGFARFRWSGQAGNASNNLSTDSTAEFDLAVSGTLT